eukprot:13084437-Heterocapsa_arctica.AAC.1
MYGNQVKHIIHNKAEVHWAQCMEYDVDCSGLKQILKQTIDNKSWGGFERIVISATSITSKLKFTVFGNDIQHSDGDDFIADKSCISLLYCNHTKWGEQPNHYDLLHTNQQDYKTGQIFITNYRDNIDSIQREWEGYFEARANALTHQEPNLLHQEEAEQGIIITSINLSGSETYFDYMLEHCKYHIMLIQEHWIFNEDVGSWKSKAFHKWGGMEFGKLLPIRTLMMMELRVDLVVWLS